MKHDAGMKVRQAHSLPAGVFHRIQIAVQVRPVPRQFSASVLQCAVTPSLAELRCIINFSDFSRDSNSIQCKRVRPLSVDAILSRAASRNR